MRNVTIAALAATSALLLAAAPAGAWSAHGSYGSVYIDGVAGETHDASIVGVAGGATAGYKTADSVVIRDTSAPVTGVGANCTKVDAHDMRCTSPFGAQRVFLDYTAGDGWDAVDIPVASAPFSLDAKLGPGWDYLTVYGPVGVTATTGPGDDYVKLDATGTNATTPPGGTIDTGYGWDQLFIANGHREDPICGPDFDTLKSDPGENDPSCESVEHPSPQY